MKLGYIVRTMISSQGLKTNIKVVTLLSVLTGLFLAAGYIFGGTSGMIIGLLFAGLMNFASYWYSDRIVLRMYGATEMSEEQYPELHESLRQLSERADIPVPRLYLSDMDVPNAFATGRSPEKGVVCVTEGLLRELEMNEIEGVVSHELAHIKNRDTLINSVVATLAGALGFMAEMLFWGTLLTGRREGEGEAFAAFAFMIMTPLIATLIRLGISRSMEYRADSNGVQIHGSKDGLKSALQKIDGYSSRSRPKHSAKYQETGSNLFISNPFKSDTMTSLLSTHPSLDKRMENIEETEI
ncbi:MAG: zinc metalloprotease HtpX [Candidatus Nanohaloarchaea archaeon]